MSWHEKFDNFLAAWTAKQPCLDITAWSKVPIEDTVRQVHSSYTEGFNYEHHFVRWVFSLNKRAEALQLVEKVTQLGYNCDLVEWSVVNDAYIEVRPN